MKIYAHLAVGLNLFGILFLVACTPSAKQQATNQNAATSAALEAVKKADTAKAGKEADLNRGAKFAYVELKNPVLGSKLLDAQLTLTGPQQTTEAILEQEVRDLQAKNSTLETDKSALLSNIEQLNTDDVAAHANFESEWQKSQSLTLKLATSADQEAKDNSWGGLYGLVRYGEKSIWSLALVACGLVVLILIIRFSSIWLPEAGLLLTGIEHGFAFVFQLVKKIVGPGVVDAAGWIEKEVAHFPLPIRK